MPDPQPHCVQTQLESLCGRTNLRFNSGMCLTLRKPTGAIEAKKEANSHLEFKYVVMSDSF